MSSENPEDHPNVDLVGRWGAHRITLPTNIASSFLLCFLVLSIHLDASSEDCLFKHNYSLAGHPTWLCVSSFCN